MADDSKRWVKPEDIIYEIEKEWSDDLNDYFEVIMDDSGIHIIPKGVVSIEIESDVDDAKRVKLDFVDGRKHIVANIHIGDMVIIDKESLTTTPKPLDKKSFIKKVKDMVNKEENE